VIPFFREENREITGSFTAVEAELISSLATQVAGLLGAVASRSDDPELAGTGIGGSTDRHDDPALARLLPNAYSEDDDASREFRQLTERGLASRKIDNAVIVLHTLEHIAALALQPLAPLDDAPTTVPDDASSLFESHDDDPGTEIALDEPTAIAWLRTLTDIRLTIAARLGIESDDDTADETDDAALVLADVYNWLGLITESLVEAVDS
jgi:hypothetical protein